MPSRERAENEAAELMLDFAARTGLTSERPSRRYLWTDAYAVCNFLALTRTTGEQRYIKLALMLVDRVHRVLGRYRPDDTRRGWLSGLDDREARLHPTQGGLRIGKMLPERPESEPFDDRLEWERDGQYFHYLTKWMQALDRAALETREVQFNVWARELAERAHSAFVYGSHGGTRRMMWKMSTDLSRPLVPAMGQLDALDGFITYVELQATAARLDGPATGPSLEAAIADFATMLEGQMWATADALGLGGLLSNAARVSPLIEREVLARCDLLETMLGSAVQGLADYTEEGILRGPAAWRLGFRELGLSLGVASMEARADDLREADAARLGGPALQKHLQALSRHFPLASTLREFWRQPASQRSATWLGHRDINEVMLATCLLPIG